jgi:phage/plasmid-like protein (TIGR03299 family)
MAANVGEMFYYGHIPWHGLGLRLAAPATLEEALRAGGLDWLVEDMPIQTCDDPPTQTDKRKAIVRADRPPGHEGRVVGVVHQGFRPVQNRDAALLFDSVFGAGKRSYHTGGYLGNGEVIWLLAKIDQTLNLGGQDVVQPYALLANSHDGSRALSISLTTIRVVCQNTLNMALQQKRGERFHRSHSSNFLAHAEAAQEFFEKTMKELETVTDRFTRLTKVKCSKEQFISILERLLPIPPKPRKADRYPGVLKAWEARREDVLRSRKEITHLREAGKGASLETAAGTFWGVLNAIIEYIDHHREIEGARIAYALFGEGMDLKTKAYRLIQDEAATAA